jgi:hypothetical protein
MIKKLALALVGLLTTLSLLCLGTVSAEAKTRFVENIGLITGYYGGGDYTGIKQPAWDGFCVWVERRNGPAGVGVWTTYAVNGYQDCSASNGSSAWSITGSTAAPATEGIRLRRVDTGQGFNLCSTKTECRAM